MGFVWSMQIRLLQAQAVDGGRERRLGEASYRHCYKPFLEDSFYFFNYSVKETEHKYELICKTFDRKSLLFSFSADTFCSLGNNYHTENINSPSFYCMLRLLLCYHSFTGWGCEWSCKWQLLPGLPPCKCWCQCLDCQAKVNPSVSVQHSESQVLLPGAHSACEKAIHRLLMPSNDDFRLSPEHRVL